jgi:serine/threonine protein kinase
VKPGNIMRERRTGRVVLLDLGIASRLANSLAAGEQLGTPGFMAPPASMEGVLLQ